MEPALEQIKKGGEEARKGVPYRPQVLPPVKGQKGGGTNLCREENMDLSKKKGWVW